MLSALDHWLWTPDLTSGPPSLVFYWPGLAIKVKEGSFLSGREEESPGGGSSHLPEGGGGGGRCPSATGLLA